jgi:hypothetical protein
MRLLHPSDPGRSKDVPESLVEKYLAGGWRKAEVKKAPSKKAAVKSPAKK